MAIRKCGPFKFYPAQDNLGVTGLRVSKHLYGDYDWDGHVFIRYRAAIIRFKLWIPYISVQAATWYLWLSPIRCGARKRFIFRKYSKDTGE